eukprot:snap_masked-scaffold_57-processed-gene-0.30-mRNA-1 protein AED:1.00 eAED:1.00 QI:0/-1/0/0/-1/1/1/0/60
MRHFVEKSGRSEDMNEHGQQYSDFMLKISTGVVNVAVNYFPKSGSVIKQAWIFKIHFLLD